jgi:hypothetical protein
MQTQELDIRITIFDDSEAIRNSLYQLLNYTPGFWLWVCMLTVPIPFKKLKKVYQE